MKIVSNSDNTYNIIGLTIDELRSIAFDIQVADALYIADKIDEILNNEVENG